MSTNLRKLLTGLLALASAAAIAAPAVAGASTHHATHRTRHRVVHRSSGIPQHNGGDRDSDNRGGPSDGDGNM